MILFGSAATEILLLLQKPNNLTSRGRIFGVCEPISPIAKAVIRVSANYCKIAIALIELDFGGESISLKSSKRP